MSDYRLAPPRPLTLEELTEIVIAMIGDVSAADLPRLRSKLPTTGQFVLPIGPQ